MAKDDAKSNQDPKAPDAPTPAEQENLKLHGETQGVDAREVEAHELIAGVRPREVSDEELSAIEEAGSEPTLAAEEVSEEDRNRVTAYESVGASSGPSRDSADYVYRDIHGTTIVGYQEQVSRSELED